MLHTIRRLIGSPIHVIDGTIGTLFDVYFNDTSWSIEFFVIEIDGLLFDKRVLIAPSVLAVGADGELHSVLSKYQVKLSPDWERQKSIFAHGRLRSMVHLFTYTITEKTRNLGGISDFAFKPAHWIIEHIIADDRSEPMPRIILVPVSCVERISFEKSTVYAAEGTRGRNRSESVPA